MNADPTEHRLGVESDGRRLAGYMRSESAIDALKKTHSPRVSRLDRFNGFAARAVSSQGFAKTD